MNVKARSEESKLPKLISDFNLDDNLEMRNGGAARKNKILIYSIIVNHVPSETRRSKSRPVGRKHREAHTLKHDVNASAGSPPQSEPASRGSVPADGRQFSRCLRPMSL